VSTEPAPEPPPEPVTTPDGIDRETVRRAGVATALVLLIGLAFVWSYVGALHEPKFHGVELAVAGPAALAQRLDASEAFSVTRVPTRPAAARVGTRHRHRRAPAPAWGLLSVALVHAIGPLRGHYLALALAGVLLCFAVGNLAVGLQAALGVLGTGTAILLFVVLGNPSSGGPFSTDLPPGFWRAIGPWLPTGAGVDLIRTIAYFDGNATARPVAVLAAWMVLGILLAALFARVRPLGLGMKADHELETAQAEALSAAAAG